MMCYLYPEPTFFFFTPDVPELLYYSHIPAVVVALLVGAFVYMNGREFLLNRLLFVIALLFSLWSLSNLVLWTNIHGDQLLLAWTLYSALFTLISVFSVYFTYVFVEQKDAPPWLKYIFLAVMAPAIALGPTSVNLGGIDITNCDAFMFEGFWYKVYYISVSVISMLAILWILIRGYIKAAPEFRKQIAYVGVGIEFFLFSFFTIVFLATYLTIIGLFEDSRLELYGLFGMLFFMALIATVIVRFKAFHAGILAAQALVVALTLLIGSMFTFADEFINIVLIAITLVLTAAIGIVLIRSVKKEVAQRELIERQEKELEIVNQQQESLLHFISHEVKGYLTKSAAAFASIAGGDYAEAGPQLKSMSSAALVDVRRGVDTVMDILDASNLKKGTVSYAKQQFDLVETVQQVVQELSAAAKEKGIEVVFERPAETFLMTGDSEKIRRHVIRNIVDNSIKYTPHGSVRIAMSRREGLIRIIVSDTGVGISAEDMKHLFTEGGHGKDSIKVNVHSTGYGLFIAKQIVEGHGGSVWAESEGADKGSRFVIELPENSSK